MFKNFTFCLDMTGAVWFRQQNSTNSFIVHFVCMNRRSMVENRQVQEIETLNKTIMGIDNSLKQTNLSELL